MDVKRILGILIVGLWAQQVFAQVPSGGIIVRIDDGEQPRCIDPRQDRLWVTLKRVVVSKANGWFTNESKIALAINATVKPLGKQPQTFPLYAEATLDAYPEGQVSVPIEYAIAENLQLKQEGTTLGGVNIDVTMLNLRDLSRWGTALKLLGEEASNLPIPSSPVTDTAKYLLDIANGALKADIEKRDIAKYPKAASIVMNFHPSGQCDTNWSTRTLDSGFESTGTIAVVQAQGVAGAGLVDIRNEYCWTAQYQPIFTLRAARKQSGKACNDPALSYQPITNNHIAFFVNAAKVGNVLSAVDKKDVEASRRRCLYNGVSAARCLGTS